MVVIRFHRSRCFNSGRSLFSVSNNKTTFGASVGEKDTRDFSVSRNSQRQASNDTSKSQYPTLNKVTNLPAIDTPKISAQLSRTFENKNSEAGYFNSVSRESSKTFQDRKEHYVDSSYHECREKESSKQSRKKMNKRKDDRRATVIKYQDIESSIYNHFHYHYFHSQQNPFYRENMPNTKMPVLDASPLFDPALFCRTSALNSCEASINGTLAAKRLRQGKQLAVDILQHDLCNWGPASKMKHSDKVSNNGSSKLKRGSLLRHEDRVINSESDNLNKKTKTLKVQSPPWTRLGGLSLLQSTPETTATDISLCKSYAIQSRRKITDEKIKDDVESATTRQYHRKRKSKAFVLEGHGVPWQLFQDHIDFCDTILSKHGGATECSFNNFDGKLAVDWMRIRGKDGKNFASPWPPRHGVFGNDGEEFEQRLQLYLTVMNRLSTTFGKVLDPNPKYSHNIVNPFHGSDSSSDEEDDDGTVIDRPRHWNVQFLRGIAYPSCNIPRPKKLSPIVELTQREGIVAPRNVRICLQSVPSSRGDNLNGDGPVTLVFDACFSKTLLRR